MIKVTIDPRSLDNFRHGLELYKEQVGKTQRDATIELARAVCKELAIKIHPFGVSSRAGKKFEGSIRKQVWRAIKNSQVEGTQETIEQAHKARRGRSGAVSKNLRTEGQMRKSPYAADDVSQYAIKKSKNAGLVKGAWIAAGQALTGKPISGVGIWVKRHANKNGSARVSADPKTATVYVTNELDYVRKAQRSAYVSHAIRTAYRKQYARMRIEARKTLDKTI